MPDRSYLICLMFPLSYLLSGIPRWEGCGHMVTRTEMLVFLWFFPSYLTFQLYKQLHRVCALEANSSENRSSMDEEVFVIFHVSTLCVSMTSLSKISSTADFNISFLPSWIDILLSNYDHQNIMKLAYSYVFHMTQCLLPKFKGFSFCCSFEVTLSPTSGTVSNTLCLTNKCLLGG